MYPQIDHALLNVHGWRFVEASEKRPNQKDRFVHAQSKTEVNTYNEVLDWIIDNHQPVAGHSLAVRA